VLAKGQRYGSDDAASEGCSGLLKECSTTGCCLLGEILNAGTLGVNRQLRSRQRCQEFGAGSAAAVQAIAAVQPDGGFAGTGRPGLGTVAASVARVKRRG